MSVKGSDFNHESRYNILKGVIDSGREINEQFEKLKNETSDFRIDLERASPKQRRAIVKAHKETFNILNKMKKENNYKDYKDDLSKSFKKISSLKSNTRRSNVQNLNKKKSFFKEIFQLITGGYTYSRACNSLDNMTLSIINRKK